MLAVKSIVPTCFSVVAASVILAALRLSLSSNVLPLCQVGTIEVLEAPTTVIYQTNVKKVDCCHEKVWDETTLTWCHFCQAVYLQIPHFTLLFGACEELW